MADTGAAYDVFISYSRVDSDRAVLVRDKLQAMHVACFFDAEGIDSGAEFPAVIDQAVKGASAVLALWSAEAIQRRWVRIEGRIGLDRGTLVAAAVRPLQPTELPAEFYNVNLDDLSDFDGADDHPAWLRVLRTLGRKIGRDGLESFSRAAAARDFEALKQWARSHPRDPLCDEAWALASRFEREAPARPAAATPRFEPRSGGGGPGAGPAPTGAPGPKLGLIAAIGAGAAALVVVAFVLMQQRPPSAPAQAATEIAQATPANPEGSPAGPEAAPEGGQTSEGPPRIVASPDLAQALAAREQAAREQAARDNEARDRAAYDLCASRGTGDACEAYLRAFPNGAFADRAQGQLRTLAAAQAAAQAAARRMDLSGGWRGYYGQEGQRVRFDARLTGSAGQFEGRMSEPNTFAPDRSVTTLTSVIRGSVSADGAVRITKTYDGAGGVSHSVQYTGTISENGDVVEGQWNIGATRGVFVMERY